MDFKKDYINYVLHDVMQSEYLRFEENPKLKKLIEKVISTEDVMKITYLVGKTAGLELLFKYLLYISDKVDKSQISIFTLRDNFDYDVQNLRKIFGKIEIPEPHPEPEKADLTEEKKAAAYKPEEAEPVQEEKTEEEKPEITEIAGEPASGEAEEFREEKEEAEASGKAELELIENIETETEEGSVFELTEIEEGSAPAGEDTYVEGRGVKSVTDLEEDVREEPEETPEIDKSVSVLDVEEKEEEKPELEIEIMEPVRQSELESIVKEETVTNEVYLKFENMFFEDVKILEKLFSRVGKLCSSGPPEKLSEKNLGSLSQIIEISSELANMTRQLSFDLTADIFFTMNLFFTKAISAPSIITRERIKLLESSLKLMTSLIKGEDYLDYDVIADKIEALKNEMLGYKEKEAAKSLPEAPAEPEETEILKPDEGVLEESRTAVEAVAETREELKRQEEFDSENFKMRYLVKEFEKCFQGLSEIKGEYVRFDVLEKIDELNNSLRMIAKISASSGQGDILKLSEVSYVFLKYLKDYRMDLMDPEIRQIIKYIIFTFKMLLTHRKPEDFNVLVQYLNNPVKIFADS